jgi:hypothetical protein
MLQIMVTETPTEQRWVLEGRLARPCVRHTTIQEEE